VQSLLPFVEKKVPRWAGAGQTYGLSTGSDDVYQAPSVYFLHDKQEQGGGIFLAHVRLPAEGTILSAFFPLHTSSTDGASLEMVIEGNIIALVLSAAGVVVEIPVYLDIFEAQGFIPITTEFYIRSYRLEAKITLGENLRSNAGSINLPLALSGEGRIRLGGQERFRRANRLTIPVPAVVETAKSEVVAEDEDEGEESFETAETISSWTENHETNTVWDEFAILLSSVALLPEEVVVESVVEAAVTNAEPAPATEAPMVYVQPKIIVPETDEEKLGGDEMITSSVADTDVDDSVQEQEMLSVLSEDS
jgi:hypothetical protein